MKTLAALLVEQNKPLELEEVEIPKLQFGQVLVELQSSRICGSQLGEIAGVKGPDKWLPHLIGHEGSGIVLETGPEVSTVSPGDKVCLHWRPSEGIQSKPPTYRAERGLVNAGYVTTFNHHAVVSENRLTVVPKDLDDEIISLLADTLTTGFGVVCRDARVSIGESVVVVGVGGIGLGVILGAKLAGAYPIIAVDLFDHKLEKAKEFGATHVINSTSENFTEKVISVLGSKPDLVVDGTGHPRIIEEAYNLTSDDGSTVLFGVMHHENRVNMHTLPLHFGKTLVGSEGGSSLPHLDIPKYIRMFQAGLFDPKAMVSHRGKLEQVNELIDEMKSGKVIHAIMHF